MFPSSRAASGTLVIKQHKASLRVPMTATLDGRLLGAARSAISWEGGCRPALPRLTDADPASDSQYPALHQTLGRAAAANHVGVRVLVSIPVFWSA